MGIWEFIGSATETLKQNAPDVTLVKDACCYNYAYGAAAFTKIGQAVKVNQLGEWMPDDETKSKIVLYSTIFAKQAGSYALKEGYKLVPGGGAVSKILSETLNEIKQENLKVKQSDGGRILVARESMINDAGAKSLSGNQYRVKSAADRSPEDVIRIFMMKEFFGNRFLDGLIVQDSAKGKWKKHI